MSGVLLLQFYDDVSDQEAIARMSFDLRWKGALNLPLDFDPPHSSSLSVFRGRLVAGGQERYAFNRLIRVGREAGFLPDKLTVLVDSMAQHGAGAVRYLHPDSQRHPARVEGGGLSLARQEARANRVFGDKVNGLIVDYIGVFRDLQKALAIYGSAAGGGVGPGELPVQPKAALVEQLRQAIGEATGYCTELGIDLEAVQAAEGFQRVKLLEDAVEAVLVNDETKRKFLGQVVNVDRLFKAILPDQVANELSPARAALVVIADKLRSELPDVDISDVMADVEALLDRSVAAQPYVIHEPAAPYDLTRIDFAKLQKAFAQGRKHTEAAKLQAAISAKLHHMVALNKSRMDYLEQFQKMIDEYNAGASDIDLHFARLIAFVQGLNDEEQRGVKEHLSEEELAVFDLLTRPDIKLKRAEREQVKQVAKELLVTLKAERLVLDWRKRQQTRAMVQLAIEEALDRLPSIYTTELYRRKCDAVYQHVYDSYHGEGRSVYAMVG